MNDGNVYYVDFSRPDKVVEQQQELDASCESPDGSWLLEFLARIP